MLITSDYTIPVTEAIVDVLLPSLQKTVSYISPNADLTNTRAFLTAVINPLVIGLYYEVPLNTVEEFDSYTKELSDNIGQNYKLSELDLATSYLQTGEVIAVSVSKPSLYTTSSNTVDRTSQSGKKIYIEGTATHIIEPVEFTYSTVSVPEFAKGIYTSTLDAATNIPITSSVTQIVQYNTNSSPSVEVIGNVTLNSKVSSAIRLLVTDPSYSLPILEQSSTIGTTNDTSFKFLYNTTVTNVGYSAIAFSTKNKVVV